MWFNACSAGGVKAFPYGGSYNVGGTCNTQGGSGQLVNVGQYTSCVGGYAGIYDMSGNAWEWEDACDGTTGMNDKCRIRGGGVNNGDTTGARCNGQGATDYQNRWLWGEIGIRCCQP